MPRLNGTTSPVRAEFKRRSTVVRVAERLHCRREPKCPVPLVPMGERWNGLNWSIQPNADPARTGGLDGVSCPSPTVCTAVGIHSDAPLVERWMGTTWSIQRAPNPADARVSTLWGVSCASATACTAVGSYSIIGTYHIYLPLAERWNGRRWSIQRTPTPSGTTDSFLGGVSCASPTACTAVGSYVKGVLGNTLSLVERWNGRRWSIQRTPNPADATVSSLSGVSCASATACTAVGGASIVLDSGATENPTLVERWNGRRWSIQRTPNPTGPVVSGLGGVSCASATVCTAVGGVLIGVNTRAPESLTLVERWNGRRWSIQPTPNPALAEGGGQLLGVSCPSPITCTAVGYYNRTSLVERWNAPSPDRQS